MKKSHVVENNEGNFRTISVHRGAVTGHGVNSNQFLGCKHTLRYSIIQTLKVKERLISEDSN